MIEINLKLISDGPTKLAYIQPENLDDIYSFIFGRCHWTNNNYYLICNGRGVLHFKDINGSVQVVPRIRGGKGGFGSMLRAIGAQIEKTTNREACRDLSGRRLRDINEEQRLKKWISQQAEREREVEERRKKKLEKLSSQPKHVFKDDAYFEERSEMPEKISDAFEQGLQASTSSTKRKSEVEEPVKKKRKKLLMDFDDLSSSDDSEEISASDNGDASSEHLINTEERSKIVSEDIKIESASTDENSSLNLEPSVNNVGDSSNSR